MSLAARDPTPVRRRSQTDAVLKDVVQVRPLEDHRLHIRFEDGVEGEIDIASLISFDGVFAPLRDPAMFRAVMVHPELGTICWPNGADLDPDVLYAEVTGRELLLSKGRARAS